MKPKRVSRKPRKAASVPSDATGTFRTIKRWLVVVTLLVIAAWVAIVVLVLQYKTSEAASRNPTDDPKAILPATVAGRVTGRPGPWGRLEYQPIIISPPLGLVPEATPGSLRQVAWHFPNTDRAQLAAWLAKIDLPPSLRESLSSMARTDDSIHGLTILPTRQFVVDLTAESRSALYVALSEFRENVDQGNVFRFRGSSPDEWFRDSPVSPETRKLVEPLIYRHGRFMFFADLRSIQRWLGSRSERLELIKTLRRDSTLMVHLQLSPDSDLEGLVRYWGRGGREQEVRPILESLLPGEGTRRLNVTHLLPPLARRRIYTYPAAVPQGKIPPHRDCHWTSLNFFHEVPDDALCNEAEVSRALANDYDRIEGDLRLGDVVVFLSQDGLAIHSAIYIADDVFFHRCGTLLTAPWILSRFEDLKDYYPRHRKLEVVYCRHRDL